MQKQLLWLFFSFRGRLRRAAFWWSLVWASVAFAVLFAALDAALGYGSTLLLYPPYFWALAALGTKRLHDRGKRRSGSSGSWCRCSARSGPWSSSACCAAPPARTASVSIRSRSAPTISP